jgi:hypothetical protein
MTETEKLKARIEAVDEAIAQVKTAMNVDRKMSGAKNINGHFTRALTELTSILHQLLTQIARAQQTDK